MKLNRVSSATDENACDKTSDALFLDSVRLSHLGAEAAIQTEAEDPRPLPVAHLPVTSAALRSIGTGNGGSAVEVQVGGHPGKEGVRLAFRHLSTAWWRH
jgi:hypothetical protein